jgi:Fe-S-cluster containining protein
MRRKKAPWFAAGLRFECSGCGDCCRGAGYVWVDRSERKSIGALLGLELDDFDRRYTRLVDRRRCLTDGDEGDCIFWQGRCLVYAKRPKQCRTFPFWRENLRDPATWGIAAEACPGMNRGPLFDRHEIEELMRGKGGMAEQAPLPEEARDQASRP